jgi:hypothetical protein
VLKTFGNCRYYECNIKGEQKELLCPDGLVYDEKSQNCDYPSKVVCGPRTELRKFIFPVQKVKFQVPSLFPQSLHSPPRIALAPTASLPGPPRSRVKSSGIAAEGLPTYKYAPRASFST